MPFDEDLSVKDYLTKMIYESYKLCVTLEGRRPRACLTPKLFSQFFTVKLKSTNTILTATNAVLRSLAQDLPTSLLRLSLGTVLLTTTNTTVSLLGTDLYLSPIYYIFIRVFATPKQSPRRDPLSKHAPLLLSSPRIYFLLQLSTPSRSRLFTIFICGFCCLPFSRARASTS